MSKENTPIPQGNYAPAIRHGDLIFTAGMTPRQNGVLIRTGKIGLQEDASTYGEAVQQAAANALSAVRSMLQEGESIGQVLTLTVYINAVEGFTAHPKVADVASNYLFDQIGPAGIGSRAAIGVASLPGDAPCEIQIVASVKSH